MSLILTSFHAFAFTVNVYTLFYDFVFITWPGRAISDKLFKLTVYNFTLSTIYWALRLFNTFPYKTAKWKRKEGYGNQRNLDLFLRAVVLPQSTIVFLMFWVIYLYNPDLLRSKELRGYIAQGIVYIPEWLVHSYHTNIIILPLIEFILNFHSWLHNGELHWQQQRPTDTLPFMNKTTIFCIFNGFYSCVILTVGVVFDSWPYPLLNELPMFLRILIGLFMLSMGSLIIIMTDKLEDRFRQCRINQKREKKIVDK